MINIGIDFINSICDESIPSNSINCDRFTDLKTSIVYLHFLVDSSDIYNEVHCFPFAKIPLMIFLLTLI